MSEESLEPKLSPQNPQLAGVKPAFKLNNLVAILFALILVAGVAFGVMQLRPVQAPEGRPVGSAGEIQAFAVPSQPSGESFTVWRGNRQISTLPSKPNEGFQRVELSSNDVDIAGNNAPDLVLYTWTGGAHCCFSQILIDGHTGKTLGQLALGNGDPTPFLAATTKGLARAVVIGVDDVCAYKFGSYADSPMARIVIAWDGKRFGLDIKRMKATTPESPPAFFINEPELGEAATIGVEDFGIDEDAPGSTTSLTANAQGRGDRAKSYQIWMANEEARMRATTLNLDDPASFGPMAAFLNERVYKGQAAAGVETVMSVYEATPQARNTALAYYFEVLGQSRWLGDLNALNNGQLSAMLAKGDQAISPKR
jgi:hypothetical protein